MNERILELADEARIKFSSHWAHEGVDTAVIIRRDLKEFAELIVKECAKVAEDVANADGEGPWFEGYISGVEEVNRRMKQHFGVRE